MQKIIIIVIMIVEFSCVLAMIVSFGCNMSCVEVRAIERWL